MTTQNNSRVFATGSRRDSNKGKPRIELISPHFLTRLGLHMAAGAEKYGDRNWEKGQPREVLVESFMRHAVAILEGRTDEDHISAAAFGLMALAHFEAVGWPKQIIEADIRSVEIEQKLSIEIVESAVGKMLKDALERRGFCQFTEAVLPKRSERLKPSQVRECGDECDCRFCLVDRAVKEDEFASPVEKVAPTITVPLLTSAEPTEVALVVQSDEGLWVSTTKTIPAERILRAIYLQGKMSGEWTRESLVNWLQANYGGLSDNGADSIIDYFLNTNTGRGLVRLGTDSFRWSSQAFYHASKMKPPTKQ